jgi:uracil-DNA glycosylase family 4
MRIVNGEGIVNPKIAIVGEAPGDLEDMLGRPFVGRSGKYLNKILKELGIDRKQLYITNAVKFKIPKNRALTEDEIAKWYFFLREELYIVKPQIILTLGTTATKALLLYQYADAVKVTKIRGQIFDFGPLKFIPTFHPSYCMRFPGGTELFKEDFRKALEYVK